MKKLISLTLFCLLIVAAYWLWPTTPSPEEWTTFKKATPQKIDSYPTTAKEKKAAQIDQDESPQPDQGLDSSKREPAAVKRQESDIPESLPGRQWGLYPNQKVPQKITFKNEVNPEWKSLLGQDVLRFLRPDTKLFVKKEKSLTLLERGLGRHVEQVYVKMISPEGRHFSYHAYVDSESGKVIRTWNNTIHEPMGKETPKFRPSGFINPDGATRF
jgi:hypothetical protein